MLRQRLTGAEQRRCYLHVILAAINLAANRSQVGDHVHLQRLSNCLRRETVLADRGCELGTLRRTCTGNWQRDPFVAMSLLLAAGKVCGLHPINLLLHRVKATLQHRHRGICLGLLPLDWLAVGDYGCKGCGKHFCIAVDRQAKIMPNA